MNPETKPAALAIALGQPRLRAAAEGDVGYDDDEENEVYGGSSMDLPLGILQSFVWKTMLLGNLVRLSAQGRRAGASSNPTRTVRSSYAESYSEQ